MCECDIVSLQGIHVLYRILKKTVLQNGLRERSLFMAGGGGGGGGDGLAKSIGKKKSAPPTQEKNRPPSWHWRKIFAPPPIF